MHSEAKKNLIRKKKRAFRVRNKVRGTSEVPRLSIVKTNKHIYAQIIDDEASKTLLSASTRRKVNKGEALMKKNVENAKQIGLSLAEQAKSLNIMQVRFDRGAHKYHGVVEAIAVGAREGGLNV